MVCCRLDKTGLKVLVGRSSQCDYIIENPESHGTVSGKHATIYQTDETGDTPFFYLEDHSTNGTYVNGEIVHNREVLISVNDVVTLGRSYKLNLVDLSTRYFAGSKTTKKKPKPSGDVIPEPVSEPVPYPGNSVTTINRPVAGTTGENHSPVIQQQPQIVKNKISPWYWVLLVLVAVVGFLFGYFVF